MATEKELEDQLVERLWDAIAYYGRTVPDDLSAEDQEALPVHEEMRSSMVSWAEAAQEQRDHFKVHLTVPGGVLDQLAIALGLSVGAIDAVPR